MQSRARGHRLQLEKPMHEVIASYKKQRRNAGEKAGRQVTEPAEEVKNARAKTGPNSFHGTEY